ncbi:MAG: heme-binding protein [Chitinophagaceae bacterium]|nr:heme-binding protein [Chitinophagaceae bacterium]
MKIFFIITGAILLAFIALQLYAMQGRSKIESYPYVVNKKYADFEVRSYEASLFTAVKMPTNQYKKASSKGFSILAGYIFGGNDKNEKIAMTSPVSMSLDDSMTMMFMVPKKLKKENLPQPNEQQIAFREEPAKIVAAITFGGWANDDRISTHKQQLIDALDAAGIPHSSRFYFLGYDPPWEVFNRKNEVIVELPNDVLDLIAAKQP